MNLPPDKLQLLSQYDNEKKWELVCDQVRAFIFFFMSDICHQNGHDSCSVGSTGGRVDIKCANTQRGESLQTLQHSFCGGN